MYGNAGLHYAHRYDNANDAARVHRPRNNYDDCDSNYCGDNGDAATTNIRNDDVGENASDEQNTSHIRNDDEGESASDEEMCANDEHGREIDEEASKVDYSDLNIDDDHGPEQEEVDSDHNIEDNYSPEPEVEGGEFPTAASVIEENHGPETEEEGEESRAAEYDDAAEPEEDSQIEESAEPTDRDDDDDDDGKFSDLQLKPTNKQHLRYLLLWDERYDQLSRYKQRTHTTRVRESENKQLFNWVGTHRMKYHAGKLSRERYDRL